jgi:monoamine oxidase
MRKEPFHDVIVIGAGAAGLSAAAEAERRGLSVLVLEASDRVGGRTWTTFDSAGVPLDLGAQLINADMTEVTQLARTAGIDILPLESKGRALLIDAEGCHDLDPEMLPHPSHELEAFKAAMPPQGDISISDLVQATVAPDAAPTMLAFIEEMASKNPSQLSARALLNLVDTYTSQRDDAEAHLSEGLGGLITALAHTLQSEIRLGHPVERIDQDYDCLIVRGNVFDDIRCRTVVIAVPPVPASRIVLPGALHDQTEVLLRSFVSGDIIKYLVSYPRPFWRDAGLNGQAVFLHPERFTAIDSSRSDAKRASLTVFVGGDVARRWSLESGQWRAQRVIEALTLGFGAAAATPTAVIEQVWIDHLWCGGGYNAQVRIGGVPDASDAIRRISGPITFAGSEYAVSFRGFVEGALRDGRAAIDRLDVTAIGRP